MLICEIGLNHLGSSKWSDVILHHVLDSKIDAITFQIRENQFYENGFAFLKLDENYYSQAIKKVKSRAKKFGIALSNLDYLSFFESLGTDFYKILSKDITNLDFLQKFRQNTNKDIYLSTGTSSEKDINKALEILGRKTTLIHTQLTNDINQVNLKAIFTMKSKFKVPVAFGNHCDNFNILYACLGYEPSDIFFYVKGSDDFEYPDDKHSIPLNRVNEVANNIKCLSRSLGDGVKKEMKNTIEGQK